MLSAQKYGENLHVNYSPFGTTLYGRNWSSEKYRYGFNGMEKDDELKGSGNSYDFGARMYDSRLGVWLSLDLLSPKYPSLSPYVFVANNPQIYIDPNGKDIYLVIDGVAFNIDESNINLITNESIRRAFQDMLATRYGAIRVSKFMKGGDFSDKADIYVTIYRGGSLGEIDENVDGASGYAPEIKFDSDGNIVNKNLIKAFGEGVIKSSSGKRVFAAILHSTFESDMSGNSDDFTGEGIFGAAHATKTLFHEILHSAYKMYLIPGSEHHDVMGHIEDTGEMVEGSVLHQFLIQIGDVYRSKIEALSKDITSNKSEIDYYSKELDVLNDFLNSESVVKKDKSVE